MFEPLMAFVQKGLLFTLCTSTIGLYCLYQLGSCCYNNSINELRKNIICMIFIVCGHVSRYVNGDV